MSDKAHTKEKTIWTAKRKEPMEVLIDEEDFEESRRCLLNSYSTNIQTHAGIIIALAIGLFATISAFKDFIIYGFAGWTIILLVILGISLLSALMYLRIVYWSMWVSYTLGITIDDAMDYFNKRNETQPRPYSSRAPNTYIIQIGVVGAVKDQLKIKNLVPKLTRWAIKTAGESF